MLEIVGKLMNLHFAGRPFWVRVKAGETEHVLVAWGVDSIDDERLHLHGPRYMDPIRYVDILDVGELPIEEALRILAERQKEIWGF